jgi:hypothetical protein
MEPAIQPQPAPAAATPPALAVWEFAGLMLTYRCTARCAHCYVGAGPDRSGDLSIPAALELWRGLDALAAAHGKSMRIHLTGGEPFDDWERLAGLVRAAQAAHLSPLEKVETNASWATEDALVRTRLELLAALGVQKLVVSADIFHQVWVPLERVQRCVAGARRIFGPGRVNVRWWDFFQSPVDPRALAPAARRDAFRASLLRHPERLTGRAAQQLALLLPGQPADAFAAENCVAALLDSRHVHVDPYGHVFPGTCAGIILGRAGPGTPGIPALWDALAAHWSAHPVLAALVTGGPRALLVSAVALGYRPLAAGYASPCHLCAHVRGFLRRHEPWSRWLGPDECYPS